MLGHAWQSSSGQSRRSALVPCAGSDSHTLTHTPHNSHCSRQLRHAHAGMTHMHTAQQAQKASHTPALLCTAAHTAARPGSTAATPSSIASAASSSAKDQGSMMLSIVRCSAGCPWHAQRMEHSTAQQRIPHTLCHTPMARAVCTHAHTAQAPPLASPTRATRPLQGSAAGSIHNLLHAALQALQCGLQRAVWRSRGAGGP